MRQLYTKGETIHKTLQKNRTHKLQNKPTKQEKNKKNIKNRSRVNRK